MMLSFLIDYFLLCLQDVPGMMSEPNSRPFEDLLSMHYGGFSALSIPVFICLTGLTGFFILRLLSFIINFMNLP